MRKIVIATLIAAGLGLAGATTASAAPANGTVIDDAAKLNSGVTQVQHWRWRSRRYWGPRCHYRRWSRWGRC